jgi:hypothetical protein
LVHGDREIEQHDWRDHDVDDRRCHHTENVALAKKPRNTLLSRRCASRASCSKRTRPASIRYRHLARAWISSDSSSRSKAAMSWSRSSMRVGMGARHQERVAGSEQGQYTRRVIAPLARRRTANAPARSGRPSGSTRNDGRRAPSAPGVLVAAGA